MRTIPGIAYVAAVLIAKAQGNLVRLYTKRDASGYCKVGYLAVSS